MITFESLNIPMENSPSRRKLVFAHLAYLQGIQVEFVYKGHQVKVKVTGAKKGKKIPNPAP